MHDIHRERRKILYKLKKDPESIVDDFRRSIAEKQIEKYDNLPITEKKDLNLEFLYKSTINDSDPAFKLIENHIKSNPVEIISFVGCEISTNELLKCIKGVFNRDKKNKIKRTAIYLSRTTDIKESLKNVIASLSFLKEKNVQMLPKKDKNKMVFCKRTSRFNFINFRKNECLEIILINVNISISPNKKKLMSAGLKEKLMLLLNNKINVFTQDFLKRYIGSKHRQEDSQSELSIVEKIRDLIIKHALPPISADVISPIQDSKSQKFKIPKKIRFSEKIKTPFEEIFSKKIKNLEKKHASILEEYAENFQSELLEFELTYFSNYCKEQKDSCRDLNFDTIYFTQPNSEKFEQLMKDAKRTNFRQLLRFKATELVEKIDWEDKKLTFATKFEILSFLFEERLLKKTPEEEQSYEVPKNVREAPKDDPDYFQTSHPLKKRVSKRNC
jgi:hypothetical protein